MGNQEKAAKGDTVMATSTRLFQGRVVADSEEKKGESLLASTPVVVLSTILVGPRRLKSTLRRLMALS